MLRRPPRLRGSPRWLIASSLAIAGAVLLNHWAAQSAVPTTAPPLPAPGPVHLTLKPEGGLSFDVRDARTGNPIPCKLTLVGVDGTRDPDFTRVDIGRLDGDSLVAYNRILSLSGIGVVHVPIGTYDVTVSRGPEWDIAILRKLKIAPVTSAASGAKGAFVNVRLAHVVDSSGWLSADFHVHAARSPDSRVPMADRIYEFVADDVQMIVSTDHNVVSDYDPFIRELDAGRYIASAMGDELTTAGWGHFGAFPLARELERPGQGATLVHGRHPNDFFKDVRSSSPDAIIDVHHPRLDNEVGYFNLGQFDARADRAARVGFSWDFDAVEVMNGYQDPVRKSVDRVIDDWFALLNHGHIVTATGNSDTHHLTYNIGGYPRNYVRVADDRPQAVDGKQVAQAVRNHHSFFTTAPFVRVAIGSGTIGDLVSAPGGAAQADIEVQAAPWVDVDRVILYVNGREVKRWAVAASTAAVRFHERVDVSSPGTDGYVVVRVDGGKPLTPIVGDGRRFTVYPLALTNPVFLDTDGDGRYLAHLKHTH
jgi:hypothetical protein